MENLFIVGNGFDLQHDLATKFSDFKAYIKPRCCNGDNSIGPIRTKMLPDGDVVASKEYLSKLIYSLVEEIADFNDDGKWKDFEKYLGIINWGNYLSEVCLTVEQCLKLDDNNPFLGASKNEENAEQLFEALGFFPMLVAEWVKHAESNSRPRPIPDYSSLFSKNDCAFVTFNYTFTLEDVYGVPENRICHIHGDCCFEDIIVGHDEENKPEDCDLEFKYPGVFNICDRLFEKLKKNCQEILWKNASFLRCAIKDCKNVYICGHSLGQSDDYFFEFLRDNAPSNIKIVVFDFEGDSKEKVCKLKKCFGFKNVVSAPLPGLRSV